MHTNLLKVDPRDNVLIALADFHRGETLNFDGESSEVLDARALRDSGGEGGRGFEG